MASYKIKRIIFIFLCFGYSIFRLFSQPVCDFELFSIKDGLTQGVVMDILQDKKGYIWFSTWNGLSRFDGYNFKNYKITTQQNNNTFGSNRIGSISENCYGDIWCPTYDGRACLFNPATETFTDVLRGFDARTNHVEQIHSLPKGIAWILCSGGYNYRVDELSCKKGEGIKLYSSFDGNLKGNYIYQVFQDSEGDEWVLTDKGVDIIGKKTIDTDFIFRYIGEIDNSIYLIADKKSVAKYEIGSGKCVFLDVPFDYNSVNYIAYGKERELFIGTDNGLVVFDTDSLSFNRIDIRTPSSQSGYVRYIYQDSHGSIWVFSKSAGVTRIDNDGSKYHLSTPDKEVVKHGRGSRPVIFEDKNGILWILPIDGNFSYYNRKTSLLESLYITYNNSRSVFSPLVRYYTIDRQGNCWFATARGVIKVNFMPQASRMRSLVNDSEVRAFMRDEDGRLWCGTKSGEILLYSSDGTFDGFLSPQGDVSSSVSTFGFGIYVMYEDKDKGIWIGTKGGGLFHLGKSKTNRKYIVKHYEHDSSNPYSINNNNIYDIYRDSLGHLWIGCFDGGLNLFDDDSGQFLNFGNELKNYPMSFGMKVRNISEVQNGIILLGTTDGLISFSADFNNPAQIKFYRNFHRPGDSSSIGTNDIMHIYSDSRGWIYTVNYTGGFNRVLSSNLLSDTIRFKNYGLDSGLVSDLTLSIVEDGSSYLWITSEIAVSRFNPITETIENFIIPASDMEAFFSEAIPIHGTNGSILFGTNTGYMDIDTKKMHKSMFAPPIAITDIKIQGHSINAAVDYMKEITLEPKQRNITIQFSALDYVATNNILYAYRMKGLEDTWNYSGKSRSASYLNLPAGTYELEIKSTNSDGVWVDNIRTLKVHVKPVFKETAWAVALYIVIFLLVTSLVTYVLFYIYRLRHRVSMEKQLADIKLRFFTDISHELRTPLTLISSPLSEVLEKENLSQSARCNLEVVEHNADRMLRLINQILDFRKIQNGKMKLLVEETDISAFIQNIMSNFREMAARKNIDFDIKLEEKSFYAWVDRDKLDKIIFNLLSNAFKYTPEGGTVSITFITRKDDYDVIVEDNGIGIKPDKINKLFKRFETLARDNILKPSSGIGLSLVKELVELMNGSIVVDSEPGHGCRFKITLPTRFEKFNSNVEVEFVLDDSPKSNAITSDVNENNEGDLCDSDKISILIVEDNDELRLFLSRCLKNDYKIYTAVNGAAGLELAVQMLPDMILTDVMMPEMDGLEMVGKIKENPNTSHIPIIVLSAKASLDDRISGIEQGIDDYITKPFSSSYLRVRIKSIFNQRKALQERYMAMLSDSGKNAVIDFSPSEPQVTPLDEVFMQNVMKYLEEHMDDPDLTIDDFASHLMLGRSIFYRKLKSIVGLTPVDFVREIRVKRAAQLISLGEYNFSQIAYMTGFSDPKYFSKCFKKVMGVTPTAYEEAKSPFKQSNDNI